MSSALVVGGFSMATRVMICIIWFCRTPLERIKSHVKERQRKGRGNCALLLRLRRRKFCLPNNSKFIIVTSSAVCADIFFELNHDTLYIVSVPQRSKDSITKSTTEMYFICWVLFAPKERFNMFSSV